MSSPPTTTSTMMPPGREDWQNELTLTESNRYMLDNQIDCDVWFTLLPSGGAAGEELPVTVGCHRYMLVSRSPVFFAMLSGPLAVTSTSSRTQPSPSPSPSQHRRQQQQQPRTTRHDERTSDASTTQRREIRITDIAPNTFWQLLRCASVCTTHTMRHLPAQTCSTNICTRANVTCSSNILVRINTA